MYLDITLSNGTGVFNRRKSVSAKCVLDITLNPGLTGASLERQEQYNAVFRKRTRHRVKSAEQIPLKKLAKKNAKCLLNLQYSLAAIEQEVNSQRFSSSHDLDSSFIEDKEEHSQVAAWAIGFENLLNDIAGVTVFTEFLKQEFSEENISFWRTCEEYKNMLNVDEMKVKARDIYTKYISVNAPDPVNIDGVVRQEVEMELNCPDRKTFDRPQHDVFKLMKQDSYQRFLKSDLYNTYLMREINQEPLGFPKDEFQSILCNREFRGEKKGMQGNGKEGDLNRKSKRRLSLLPWKQKASKQNVKVKSDSDLKKTSCKSGSLKAVSDSDLTAHNCKLSSPVLTIETKEQDLQMTLTRPTPGIDLHTIQKVKASNKEDSKAPEENVEFCRVILPDGSTTVVSAEPGKSIRSVIGRLCDKRSLDITAVDVFLRGSDQPVNLKKDISTLGSHEIVIEKRTLLSIELPNRKCVGVKAKPYRTIGEVLKPVLNKHGINCDFVSVQLSSAIGNRDINMEAKVSTLDNRKVIVKQEKKDLTSGSTAERYHNQSSILGFMWPPSGRKSCHETSKNEDLLLLESEL